MPHPLAYTDPQVTVDVFLKNKSPDGKREQKIAAHLKQRVEQVIFRTQKKHPYYNAIEAVRRFLVSTLQSIADDKTDILAVRVNIKGKAGPGGNHIGVDIRVP